MPIGSQYGMGKLKLLKGEEVLPQRRSGVLEQPEQWNFAVRDGSDLEPPSFNVLYVQTPTISILQSAPWRSFRQTWSEAMDLLKPVTRFGIPKTRVLNKCPYYSESFATSELGPMIMSTKLQRVCGGLMDGTIFEERQHHIPHSRPYIREPTATWVLALNLCAYWLITSQSNRGQ